MKRLLILSCILFSSYIVSAQQQAGTWATHFSYLGPITQIVQGGDLTYALTDGKLYSYSKNDEQTEVYIKKDGGNTNIAQIAYSSTNGCLIIYRDNADIDLLYANGQLVNIANLKNETQNIDKKLNSIFVNGDYAYLATNFGFLTLNLTKAEIAETAIFKIPFYSICIYQNSFYASTQNGIMCIATGKNMLDFNNWTPFPVSSKYHYSDYTFKDDEIRTLTVYKDKLHFLVPDTAIYVLETDNNVGRTLQGQAPHLMIPVSNERLLALNADGFWNFTALEQTENTPVSRLQYVITDKDNANQYWTGSTNFSLSLIKTTPTGYDYVTTYIRPDGPLSNFPFSMRYDRQKLMVVGGGFAYDNLNIPAQLSELTNNKWFNYDKGEMDAQIGAGFNSHDFASVIADPADINHLFVADWGQGLYEFKDQQFKERYTPSNTNGVLEDIFGGINYVRMKGLYYDGNGNLWMTNAMVNDPIKVMQKNGTWTNLHYPEIANDAVTNNQDLMIDHYDNKWLITTKTGLYPPYIFIFNTNGTTTDVADDKTMYVNAFSDQDGKVLNVDVLNQTVEDMNGNVWVATDVGPFVIYDSGNIFNHKLVFNKIKIPRNDGTNDADILLENVIITAIAVDGANRKWIATKSSGVYLVNDAGSETIYHFDSKNSSMPSDNVLSLAIDSQTGVVYIGTDEGLVSFGGDATAGGGSSSNVYAYPNPVRPNYDGLITVKGLQSNSTVKITDLNGNIIAQGQSLGGTYTWDARNRKGQKVATGVYLVLAASEDGSTGVATKIMIVR